MAQVCGGTTFDYVAQRKHDAAQRVLSRAADIWANQSALDLDSLIAVLLHIFLSRWSEYGNIRQETLTLEQWLPRVARAHEEVHALLPSATPALIADVMSLLQAEVSSAAQQWALGDPEQPPTAQALNTVEHILFLHKLITRPPSPKLPITVRDSSHAPNV